MRAIVLVKGGSSMRSVWVVMVIFTLTTITLFAQKTIGSEQGVILDSAKAPVYIEFVRTGRCTKDLSNFNFGDLCASKNEDASTFDAAWLRLVNNTRWAIGVDVAKGATEVNSTPVVIESTEFTDRDGSKAAYGKMLANDGAEMDVVYKSESETGCDFKKKASKGQRCFRRETTPPEIPLPAMSTDLFIAPGKSIIFPVNLSHIKEYVNFYVLYNFSWEYSGKSYSHLPAYDMQHRVYFGWFELGKAIAAEKEKKKQRA